MQMDQEIKNKIKQISNLVESVKKQDEYNNHLRNEVKEQGFLMLNEDSFYNNLKEIAQSKSKLVSFLNEPGMLDIWMNNAEEKIKIKLFLLCNTDSLEIKNDEKAAFNYKSKIIYTYSSATKVEPAILHSYTDEKAQHISSYVKNHLADEGQNHIKIQQQAKDVVSINDKNWDNKQEKFKILAEKFGDDYDMVWSSFRQAVKSQEIQKSPNGGFIFSTKGEGKSQMIEFHVTEDMKLKSASYYPNMSMINNIRNQSLHNSPTNTVKPN